MKHRFSSRTLASKNISRIINSQNVGEPFDCKILRDLAGYEPCKKNDIKCFHIMCHPQFHNRKLLVIEDHSGVYHRMKYSKCLEVAYKRPTRSMDDVRCGWHKQDVIQGFREAIRLGSVETYRKRTINRKSCCNQCGSVHNLQVDHKEKSFNTLLTEFLNDKEVNLQDVKIICEDNVTHELENILLRDEWIKFHDNRVTYQVLCRLCNIRKGG